MKFSHCIRLFCVLLMRSKTLRKQPCATQTADATCSRSICGLCYAGIGKNANKTGLEKLEGKTIPRTDNVVIKKTLPCVINK